MLSRLNIFHRILSWKRNIETAVQRLERDGDRLTPATVLAVEMAAQATVVQQQARMIDQHQAMLMSFQALLDRHQITLNDLEANQPAAALAANVAEQGVALSGLRVALNNLEASQPAVALATIVAQQGEALSGLRAELAPAAERQQSLINSMQLLLDKHNAAIAGFSAELSAFEAEAIVNRLDVVETVLGRTIPQETIIERLGTVEETLAHILPREVISERFGAVESALSQAAPAESVFARLEAVESALSIVPPRDVLFERLEAIETGLAQLQHEGGHVLKQHVRSLNGAGSLIANADNLYLTERNGVALIVASYQAEPDIRCANYEATLARISSGAIERGFVTEDLPRDGVARLHPADEILSVFRTMPAHAASLFRSAVQVEAASSPAEFYDRMLRACATNPNLVDAAWADFKEAFGGELPPFDLPERLPELAPAVPKRRSALFLHNNYYHYNQLSAALRQRGWDTLTVSTEAPTSPQRQFYHGEDLNLFDPDPVARQDKVRAFLATVPEKYGTLHFYGRGRASFFAENEESVLPPTHMPWDFMELRRHSVVIGYMPSGCLDGGRQSDIRRVTKGLCSACIWEKNSAICSDSQADAWSRRLEAVCDWIGLEGDWAVGARTGAKYVRGPVVTALDPDQWRPGLDIPAEHVIPRKDDEVIIFHGVGNDEVRRRNGRDIKGTDAIRQAVENLTAEGLAVRLAFVSKVASTQMRFIQSQADIVIDQLRYGRYGANARECMMLGRPTIGYLNALQEDRNEPDAAIAACPIVQADVTTITDVLRTLVIDPVARAAAGDAARRFMLDWHAAPVCAERYERIIDRVRSGQAPDSPDLFPATKSYMQLAAGHLRAIPAQ